jgi:hypothetical protein
LLVNAYIPNACRVDIAPFRVCYGEHAGCGANMENSMEYKPDPLYTSAITLPPEIMDLRERLAKNTKDELPESEREYDRSSAMETLKAICAAGYRIEKA